MRRGLLVCAAVLAWLRAADVVLIIPHTHWEGAVFKTREEYLEIGLPHILKALYLLKEHPEYRFVLDQSCYVKPFLERYPAEAEAFRKFVAEGRLQIAGGTDSMHDNNMPTGESIVRQYLQGKGYFRDALGYEVTTGWGLDTFGHNAQMPQILKLAGFQSYWFQRGVPGIETPAEFLWQGIDGTRIPAFWLPLSYAPVHNVPHNAAEFERMARNLYQQLTPFTKAHERVLMAGADVWEPEEHLPAMLEQFNRSANAPFRLQFAIPREYEALVSKRGERPVIQGELNPVFQGIYSSRIEVKQTLREVERILTTAEKTGVTAVWLGGSFDRKSLERAWEPVLFNQAHDLASGVMVDKVYEDTLLGYGFARRLGEDLLRSNLDAIAGHIDTTGEGIPVAVFNTLGWPRTDVAEADVGISAAGVHQIGLLDPEGRPVPLQVLRTERNGDGGIRFARVAFIARDVPSMGHAVYRVVPRETGDGAAAAGSAGPRDANTRYQDRGALENEYYRAEFNLWNGALTSLVLKEGNWQALRAPGNVVAREKDGGDFWELYGTLNGGRFTAMHKPVPAPDPLRTEWSTDFVGGTGSTQSGPVFSEFHITHPFGKNQFSTRVRLYRGVRRIDIRTEILNNEELVRYRVLFPSSIPRGHNTQEIAFGAIERPENEEYPAQNWADYGDGTHGLAVLNRGLPGNNAAGGTLLLSLLRSARLISYAYSGGYEPGVSSDTGLELGKRLTFDYALLPHSGDWRDAGAFRAGMEFNQPLIAVAEGRHSGALPKRWGLLEVSHPNVVLSALKPGRNGHPVLRVYEAAGKPAAGARIHFAGALAGVREANLMEDPGAKVEVRDNGFGFDLRPYEIKTFELEPGPGIRERRAGIP